MEIETYLARLRVCKRLVAGLLPPEMNRHLHLRARARVKAKAKASQWQAKRERAVRDDETLYHLTSFLSTFN